MELASSQRDATRLPKCYPPRIPISCPTRGYLFNVEKWQRRSQELTKSVGEALLYLHRLAEFATRVGVPGDRIAVAP